MSDPGRPTSISSDDGGMRALVRSHDWAATALGEASGWPPELRVAVELMLDARHPALVGWAGAASNAAPTRVAVLFNDAYARLLGEGGPSALGHALPDVLPDAWPRLAPLVDSALAGAAAYLDDVVLIAASGARSFSAAFSPLRDAAGKVHGYFHTAFQIDAGEHLRVEAALQRQAHESAEASRHRSEFLAVLAHELRNPMAPIRTGLEIMRLRADSPETIERVREMLERQTRQMTHLIDDLLDVARVTSGKIDIRKQLVDLNRVVASAVETSMPMIQGARHVLDVDMWGEPLLLDIDPTRIAQVINNLLTNAAKYTPPGGNIRLTVRKERSGGTGGGQAVVSVTDSGVGIPLEHQDTIFEMFNQVGRNMGLAQGGLGIGLSLVRQLVALHGGSVSAESPGTGLGSTFTVRLPLGARMAVAGDDTSRQDRRTAQRRTFRILVVDDNTDAAESLSLLLQLNSHDIRTATNGRDALVMAQEFMPDVAFLDIGMPGMTGFELATRLRAMPELAQMTIVAVTGWGSEEDQARSREAGFDQHFTKPIAAETVSRLLAALD
ncbi:ATP-binding protein [Massilia aurea]|uniref:hybrid sensor histidine kinase/response regulator n=1 Tax=Massilia aurea TaxID=373040 RepID=UPI0034637A3A